MRFDKLLYISFPASSSVDDETGFADRKSIIPETFAGEKEAVVKLFLCAADRINISNVSCNIRIIFSISLNVTHIFPF